MKTWTDEQLTILDSEYPTADLKELAGRLGKTLEAVKSKALIRKLKRSPDVRVWSPERRQKLIVLYPNHTNLEIASMLGSTESAVSGIIHQLVDKMQQTIGVALDIFQLVTSPAITNLIDYFL